MNIWSRFKIEGKQPSVWIAAIPLLVLVAVLALAIKSFGSGAVEGGSQVALLFASAVGAALAIGLYRCKWQALEDAIVENIRTSASVLHLCVTVPSSKSS